MSVPLDSDGFLRRECPTCEREFKWLPAPEDQEAAEPPDGGYFCPYCANQAPADSWFTQAQIERATAILSRDVVDPMMERWTDDVNRSNRGSGFVSISASYESNAPEIKELSESNDMRRVDFSCHRDEPVKVLDDWAGAVHCLICGSPA